MASVNGIVRLMRVPEWAKNGFVAAPLLFSGRLGDLRASWHTLVAVAALCAVSSAVYVLNDILDARRDQAHPVKRLRPIPAGHVSVPLAWGLGLGLLASGAGLLTVGRCSWPVWALVGIYLALNAAYSLYLKQKVIADVLTIAVGYVLRVLIGGTVIGVEVTHWLILCTFLLAAFLGFSKRRHELALLGPESRRTRPVLGLYSEEFLDRMSMLTLAMTLTCYVLYTIAPETITRFGTAALVYSSLIVMFALFRYLFLIHVKGMGSPVEALYYDRQIVLAIVCWVLYVVAVVYSWPLLRGMG
jgi:4-hydroxybenzoate polyprenyltransferase